MIRWRAAFFFLIAVLSHTTALGSEANCWEGVTSSNCIINAKFHNINSYDVHIQCTELDDKDGRDTGDRFGKVIHAELNGCLTRKNTNPFQLLPLNMNNLRKLTLSSFYVGVLALDDISGPFLPKLEELILIGNVVTAYSSDFFNARSIRQLNTIQFSGDRTVNPSLDQLRSIKNLQSLTFEGGNVTLDYELLNEMESLRSLNIHSTTISWKTSATVENVTAINSVNLQDSTVTNKTVLDSLTLFVDLTELWIKNITSTVEPFTTLDLGKVLSVHENLTSFTFQKQNLSKLLIDLPALVSSELKYLDVSQNLLEDIDWQWNASLVNALIRRNKFQMIIEKNPWHCEFLQKTTEEDLFVYDRDYNSINVRGIKCKHNSTRGASGPHSHRPLDLNNMWLLYGCVLSSLLLIISITYLVFAICRSRRPREPFYRSLAKWRSTKATKTDMSLRKLPPTSYETPLQYRTIEFKSEDNCEIYEEIPANATGQTLQVIV